MPKPTPPPTPPSDRPRPASPVVVPFEDRPKSRAVSFHPDNMGPDFDVIYELTHHRVAYTPTANDTAQCSVRHFPTICQFNIARLREAFGDPRPGVNPSVVAALTNGLKSIASDEHVSALLGLRHQFLTADVANDPRVNAVVSTLFGRFDIRLPHGSGANGGQTNVRMPSSTYEELCGLSADLGISTGSLLSLAVVLTLAEQPSTLKAHVKEMEGCIEDFFETAAIRARVLRAVLRELGIAVRG